MDRWKENATARAIQYVIANWHFCVCRELAGGQG